MATIVHPKPLPSAPLHPRKHHALGPVRPDFNGSAHRSKAPAIRASSNGTEPLLMRVRPLERHFSEAEEGLVRGRVAVSVRVGSQRGGESQMVRLASGTRHTSADGGSNRGLEQQQQQQVLYSVRRTPEFCRSPAQQVTLSLSSISSCPMGIPAAMRSPSSVRRAQPASSLPYSPLHPHPHIRPSLQATSTSAAPGALASPSLSPASAPLPLLVAVSAAASAAVFAAWRAMAEQRSVDSLARRGLIPSDSNEP